MAQISWGGDPENGPPPADQSIVVCHPDRNLAGDAVVAAAKVLRGEDPVAAERERIRDAIKGMISGLADNDDEPFQYDALRAYQRVLDVVGGG